jgi:K(+)-stimulated pyrophosphate-energized sodium pump
VEVSTSVLAFAVIAAVAGIGYGLYLATWIFRLDAGNTDMARIALAIRPFFG